MTRFWAGRRNGQEGAHDMFKKGSTSAKAAKEKLERITSFYEELCQSSRLETGQIKWDVNNLPTLKVLNSDRESTDNLTVESKILESIKFNEIPSSE